MKRSFPNFVKIAFSCVLIGGFGTSLYGQNYRTWDDGHATDDWSQKNNWSGNNKPAGSGEVARFSNGNAGTTSIEIDSNQSTGGMLFDANLTVDITFTNAANELSIRNRAGAAYTIVNNSDQTITFENQMGIEKAMSWQTTNLGGGGLVFNEEVDTDGFDLTFHDTNAVNFIDVSGNIIDAGGIIKTGAGTLTLTGTNTYSGGTTVSEGILQIGDNGTTGSVTGDITNNAALIFNRTNSYTYAGVISGTGTFEQAGSGTTIFTGANIYSGGTTISAGTLQIGNAGTTGSITGNITNNAALIFNRTNSYTYAGDISGTGSVTQAGTGTTILTGDATHTGTTTISAGTLQIGNAGTIGSITGDITNNAALTFDRTNSLTYAGDISGTGSVTQAGTGTTILTGDASHIGGTTVSNGTLQIGDSGTTGSVDGSIANNATLIFDRSNAITYTDTISGTGDLIKNGAGTMTLDGANTFTGTTTVNAGTLTVQGGGSNRLAPNAQVTINNTGTFEIRNSNSLDTGDADAADFTVNSGGTLSIVSGGSTGGNSHVHLGDLNLDGGTVDLSYTGTDTAFDNESAVLRGAIHATDDSTIQFGSGATTTNAGIGLNNTTSITVDSGVTLTVSAELEDGGPAGNDGFEKLGAGTLILSGDNSYSAATTITAGTAVAQNNSALGTDAAGTTVAAGATLELQNNITIASETLSVTGTGRLLNDSGTNTFSGVISGTGVVTTTGGNLTLSTTNIYSGNTTVGAGSTLTVSANNALGTGSTTVNSGGTLALTGGITVAQTSYSLAGTGNSSAGAFQNLSGSNRLTGDFALTGNTTLQSDADTLILGASTFNGDGYYDDLLDIGAHHLTIDGIGYTTLYANLSGTGNLTKNSTGTLTVIGVVDERFEDRFTGQTFINDGELIQASFNNDAPGVGPLDDFGINGNVTVGDGTGLASSAKFTLGTNDSGAGTNFSNMIAGGVDMTINSDGRLDTRGHTTYLQNITLDGGSINAQTGTSGGNDLFVTGDITSTHASQTATIDGFLDFTNDATKTISVTGTSTLDINARVQNGGIAKTGTGTLILSGGNTFEDDVDIQAGIIRIDNDAGLGEDTSSSTTVQSGAQLQLDGVNVGVEALTLNGAGISSDGALRTVTTTDNTWAGTVAVATNSEIEVTANATLAISGNITGANTLTVESIGNTTFTGTNSINILTKTGAGNLTVSNNNNTYVTANINAGDFTLGTSNILANTIDVNLGGTGTFNVGNYTDTIDDLVGSGTLEIASGGNLTIDGLGGSLSGGDPTGGFTGTLDVDGIMTLNGGLISGGSGAGSTGELILTATNTLEIASNFTFGTVGTTGGGDQLGTLTLQDSTRLVISGGNTVNIGTLNIDGDSVIDFTSAESNTLNLGSLTFTTGSSLVIDGWNSWNDVWTTQNFPGATIDIRGGNTAKITFSGFSDTDTIWLTSDFGSNEITVPEPSSYGALLIAFALAAWTTRRPRRSS